MNEKEVESEEELSPMKPYASDLSDAEWAILEPLIPPAKPGGRPRSVNMQQILNGIFYMLRSGCAWRLLPHDYPAWSTVYDYFRKWRNAGIRELMVRTLRERLRVQDETIQKRVLTRKSFSASPLVLFPVCQDAHSRTSLTMHHCSQHPFLNGLRRDRKMIAGHSPKCTGYQ